MTDQSRLEYLISAANAGDKAAQEKFFEKLSVRFSKLITLELRKHPVLKSGINIDKRSHEVCQYAIKEVKKLCPFGTPNFSLIPIMNVLHNILDTVITNLLADLAKKGNLEAENQLFSILRKRLMERITMRRGSDAK